MRSGRSIYSALQLHPPTPPTNTMFFAPAAGLQGSSSLSKTASMRLARTAAAVLLLLAVAATAQHEQPQTESAARQVIPAAASTATDPAQGKPVIMDFQQLGDCTKDTGLSAATDFCSTQTALTKPGQAHWYRFNVLEADSAFTLHFLVRTQNGRVRM